METINYAREAGHLTGTLSTLAYTLVSKGLVKHDDYEMVKLICEDAIKAAKERAHHMGFLHGKD